MSLVLVTGASGFIGSSVRENLLGAGWRVRAAVRTAGRGAVKGAGSESVAVGEIGPQTSWNEAVAGVDAIIHLAARVQLMREIAADPLTSYRRINTEGTLNLARQAAAAGVRRFIFISSIKVNGESTPPNKAFTADDPPAPLDPYGISKCEAENGLRQLASETGLEVVIIRPPLVYGPGVKANFLSMMRWLSKDAPLPFGAIHNQRSLVALDNLADLITTCVDHPAAANQIFLVADGEDLSTTELLRRLGDALGKPARLLPMPVCLLEAGAAMIGRRAIVQRLCRSLQVDISKTRMVLGWNPPKRVEDVLRDTARHFRETSA